MAEQSMPTRAIHRAHANITRAFERAQKRVASIPLGKEKIDPRTAKKRQQAAKVDRNMELELHKIKMQHRAKLQNELRMPNPNRWDANAMPSVENNNSGFNGPE